MTNLVPSDKAVIDLQAGTISYYAISYPIPEAIKERLKIAGKKRNHLEINRIEATLRLGGKRVVRKLFWRDISW